MGNILISRGKIFHNKIGELGGLAQLKAFRTACFTINLDSFRLPQCKSYVVQGLCRQIYKGQPGIEVIRACMFLTLEVCYFLKIHTFTLWKISDLGDLHCKEIIITYH